MLRDIEGLSSYIFHSAHTCGTFLPHSSIERVSYYYGKKMFLSYGKDHGQRQNCTEEGNLPLELFFYSPVGFNPGLYLSIML